MSTDTNAHVVPNPQPARRPLTALERASRVASQENELRRGK